MSKKIWLKIFLVFMHLTQRLKALKWVQLPQQCQCKLLSLFFTLYLLDIYTSRNISSIFPCHLRINLDLNGFTYYDSGHLLFGALVIQIYLLILAWSPLLCLLNCVIQISQRSLPWRPLPSVPWTIDGTVENQTLYFTQVYT